MTITGGIRTSWMPAVAPRHTHTNEFREQLAYYLGEYW